MEKVNWSNKEKRRWAFLLYKRLEMIQEEVILTHEILISLGAPPLVKLENEFKLKDGSEEKLDKWVNS
jgi:hypothetical protein